MKGVDIVYIDLYIYIDNINHKGQSTRCHELELESNTGAHRAHLFPTKQPHWFSEALFFRVAGCIRNEISIYDMEL
jgi:hypothetical protein